MNLYVKSSVVAIEDIKERLQWLTEEKNLRDDMRLTDEHMKVFNDMLAKANAFESFLKKNYFVWVAESLEESKRIEAALAPLNINQISKEKIADFIK